MPGLPMKVGKSGDMVWVRSITLVKLRGVSAATAGAPLAAKPAAAAPVKKPRRLKAARTACSHPATHIAFLDSWLFVVVAIVRRAGGHLQQGWWSAGAPRASS